MWTAFEAAFCLICVLGIVGLFFSCKSIPPRCRKYRVGSDAKHADTRTFRAMTLANMKRR
jgi:hypothetical protein